jgi:hypothetical protein
MDNDHLEDYDDMDSDTLIIDSCNEDTNMKKQQKKNGENKNGEASLFSIYDMYNRFSIKNGDVVIDFEG